MSTTTTKKITIGDEELSVSATCDENKECTFQDDNREGDFEGNVCDSDEVCKTVGISCIENTCTYSFINDNDEGNEGGDDEGNEGGDDEGNEGGDDTDEGKDDKGDEGGDDEGKDDKGLPKWSLVLLIVVLLIGIFLYAFQSKNIPQKQHK
jgi:hypothetical protein